MLNSNGESLPSSAVSDRQLSLAYLEGIIFVEIVCAKNQLSFNNPQGPKPFKNVTTRAPTKLPSGHSVWTSPVSICKTGSPVITRRMKSSQHRSTVWEEQAQNSACATKAVLHPLRRCAPVVLPSPWLYFICVSASPFPRQLSLMKSFSTISTPFLFPQGTPCILQEAVSCFAFCKLQ